MTEKEAIFVLHKLKPTIPRADGKSTTHIFETIALDLAIKALAQEQKMGRWIPVSERLPEIPFGCFVTVEEDDRNGEPQNVLYSEPVGYDGETWNRADGEPIPFEVVAWMPLQEPYKAESDVEKNDRGRS